MSEVLSFPQMHALLLYLQHHRSSFFPDKPGVRLAVSNMPARREKPSVYTISEPLICFYLCFVNASFSTVNELLVTDHSYGREPCRYLPVSASLKRYDSPAPRCRTASITLLPGLRIVNLRRLRASVRLSNTDILNWTCMISHNCRRQGSSFRTLSWEGKTGLRLPPTAQRCKWTSTLAPVASDGYKSVLSITSFPHGWSSPEFCLCASLCTVGLSQLFDVELWHSRRNVKRFNSLQVERIWIQIG